MNYMHICSPWKFARLCVIGHFPQMLAAVQYFGVGLEKPTADGVQLVCFIHEFVFRALTVTSVTRFVEPLN